MGFFLGDKYLGNIPEAVSDLITNDEEQDEKISDLDERLRQALSGVFHYKGSVATYSDLPATDNQVGDVWNVNDTGKNYAWSGSAWDDLGGIVDLSSLVTLGTNQTITGTKTISDTSLDFYEGHDGTSTSIIRREQSLDIDTETASYGFSDNGIFLVSYTGTTQIGNYMNVWDIGFIKKLCDGRNYSRGYTLPDTTSLTSDSELIDAVTDQNISGVKTFGSGIKIKTGARYKELAENGTSLVIYDLNESGTRIDYNISFENSGDTIIKKLYPAVNNTYDLGTSSFAWKDIYLGGKIIGDGANDLIIRNGSIELHVQANGFVSTSAYIIPRTNGAYDLGISANKWRDFYLSGGIKIGSTNNLITTDSSGGLQFGLDAGYNNTFYGNIRPAYDSSYSIGSSTKKYIDLYLSGKLSDGTNDVTIADLKALIDYAKTQGWIS